MLSYRILEYKQLTMNVIGSDGWNKVQKGF